MENLSKAWHLQQAGKAVQRTVRQMEQHRKEYGVSGNCFDLVFWLLGEFERAGIEAKIEAKGQSLRLNPMSTVCG